MKFPREVLNEVKWRYNKLNEVRIFYINRGSLNDESFKEGKDILSMDGFSIEFFGVPISTHIPYHRIKRIELDDKIVWCKK